MRLPLLAPFAALAAGVTAAHYVPFSAGETLVSALLLVALAALGLRCASARPGIAACLTGFAFAGAALGSLRAIEPPLRIDRVMERLALDPTTPVRLRGRVAEPPLRFEDADRFVLEVDTALRDVRAWGGVRVTVNRLPEDPPLDLRYGQRVEFLARLRRLRNFENPGAFDRAAYLRRRGVFLTATVRPRVPFFELARPREAGWNAQVWALRRAAQRRFERLAAESGWAGTRAAAILNAILLGERSAIDLETRTAFQRTGAYHTLVISGLHVGLLSLVILAALRMAGVPRLFAFAAAVAAAGVYAVLVGATLSVSRAAWMLAAYLAAALVYRQRNSLNVIAAVGLAFLVADPAVLFDAGFQLSFLSVGLIAAVAAPLIETWIEPRRRALIDVWNLDRDLRLPIDIAARRVELRSWLDLLCRFSPLPRSWTTFVVTAPLRGLWRLASVWLVSAVLLVGLAVPLTVHFQRISPASPFVNVAIAPLLALIVPLGLGSLATASTLLFRAAATAAEWTATLVLSSAAWPALELRVPPPPLWLALAAGVSLTLLAAALAAGRFRRAAAALALGCFALIAIHPFAPEFTPGRLELTAIDVGQGEALLLALPDGRMVLSDAGGVPDYGGSGKARFDVGDSVVSPYLWSRSIRRLEALALTHPDADHIGGAEAILRNFEVGELWLGRGGDPAAYGSILETARRRGAKLRLLEAGQRFEIGGVAFHVLSPARRGPEALGRNDRSLALGVRFGRHEFLLTGDLEEAGEKALAGRIEAARGGVLKAAHHGSRGSSGELLLRRFRPSLAVISAGYDNPYGHPHPEALERLRRAGALPLSTSREGLVTVSSDGERLFVSTYRWEIARRRPSGNVPRRRITEAVLR